MIPENNFDKTVREIREEPIGSEVVEEAANRAWARIEQAAHAPLRGCADFQALAPAFRAGTLPEARALLVEDHLRHCVACRKAFHSAGANVVSMPSPGARRPARWASLPAFRWAVAAAVTLMAGFSAWTALNRWAPGRGGVVAQSVEGALYRSEGQRAASVRPGEALPAGGEVVTAKDAQAVLRLRDGSLVEVRERTAFAVSETLRDTTIRLDRGGIIVKAAKRRTGHLYVVTQDCRVAVTGTVFSVNSGVKGSRVSVIEGEVRVTQASGERVLRPGEQVSTDPSVAAVPVGEEIAWSRNREEHLALLREFSALRRKLDQVEMPAARYTSRLLDRLPADTAAFISIPNPGATLGEVQSVLRQRVQESPVLRQWWERDGEGRKIDGAIDMIRAFSGYLGDELVIAIPGGKGGGTRQPMVVAEVARPGLPQFFEKQIGTAAAGHALVRGNLMLIGGSPEARERAAGGAGGFAGTPLHARVAEAYSRGAGLLLCVDLEDAGSMKDKKALQGGFENLKYFMLEQKGNGPAADTRAVLAFNGPRSGIAGWLAAPAPIGSLNFVSPDASFVASFTVKSPAAAVEELFKRFGASDATFDQKLAEAEAKLGLRIREDLLAPLGGDLTFALDGPMLPTPSWKLAVEVYDPMRLQFAIEKLVEGANREAAGQGKPQLQMAQETAGGRTYYKIVLPQAKPFGEAYYTFADGYMIAAPTRALVDSAIQSRTAGASLPRSAAFQALLPSDGHTDFSGLVYHNLGPLAGPASLLLTPQQREAMQGVAGELKPTLFVAYGESDRITVATKGSLLGMGLNSFIGGNLMSIPRGRSARADR